MVLTEHLRYTQAQLQGRLLVQHVYDEVVPLLLVLYHHLHFQQLKIQPLYSIFHLLELCNNLQNRSNLIIKIWFSLVVRCVIKMFPDDINGQKRIVALLAITERA